MADGKTNSDPYFSFFGVGRVKNVFKILFSNARSIIGNVYNDIFLSEISFDNYFSAITILSIQILSRFRILRNSCNRIISQIK